MERLPNIITQVLKSGKYFLALVREREVWFWKKGIEISKPITDLEDGRRRP